MRAADIQNELTEVLVTEEQILAKLDEVAAQVAADYEGKDLLLVGVLKGAVMVMADFSRALPDRRADGLDGGVVVRRRHEVERCRADPQGPRQDLHDSDVLIVEDIIDSGLTLSWLLENFASRGAASVEVFALLRKPDAAKVQVDCRTSGSTSRTSSSSATASTTPRSTATCGTSRSSRRTSTPDAPRSASPSLRRRRIRRQGTESPAIP